MATLTEMTTGINGGSDAVVGALRAARLYAVGDREVRDVTDAVLALQEATARVAVLAVWVAVKTGERTREQPRG